MPFYDGQNGGGQGDPVLFIRMHPQPGSNFVPTPLNPANPDGVLEWSQFRPEDGGSEKQRPPTRPLTPFREWADKLPRLECLEAYVSLGVVVGGGMG